MYYKTIMKALRYETSQIVFIKILSLPTGEPMKIHTVILQKIDPDELKMELLTLNDNQHARNFGSSRYA